MLDDRTATKPRNMTLKAYKKMKIRTLKDFCIMLTPEQIKYVNSLPTEIAVDQYCISAIDQKLKTY